MIEKLGKYGATFSFSYFILNNNFHLYEKQYNATTFIFYFVLKL